MKINYMIGSSFIDYPKEISAVVFTKGCNMNCPYCHNRNLEERELFINEEDVLLFLKKRKGLVDAITISGGEPTLHKGLVEFCRKLKKISVKIKLDTNGTNPKVLTQLINESLIDYVAMDIKAAPYKYRTMCGLSFIDVEESIEIVKKAKAFEFRTTLYPTITEEDIQMIKEWIDTDHYYLQQYRPNSKNDIKAYPDKIVSTFGQNIGLMVRGLSTVDTIYNGNEIDT